LKGMWVILTERSTLLCFQLNGAISESRNIRLRFGAIEISKPMWTGRER